MLCLRGMTEAGRASRSWRRWRVLAGALALATLHLSCLADDLDRYIARQMKVNHLPAVVLGVMREGKLIDVRVRGLANIELAVKANRRTVFEIGSISKQFTAHAVLILHERGLVDLEAPLGRYLDALPAAWTNVPIHRLLTHTSGLPDLESAFTYGVYRETPSDPAFLARLTALPVEFAPGERWSYSNTNYWLLARVIEQVSGQSYDAFMRQSVFAPLQMNATRSALPVQLLAGRAAGHRLVRGQIENRDPIQPHTGRGLGDITSSLDDMARWELEQLRPVLISRGSAQTARQPVRLNDGSTAPYGFGWDLERVLPRASLQHAGQTAGFTAAYFRVPELRLAAIVFVNAYNAPVEALAFRALRRIEPALRNAALEQIPDNDPKITLRVRELLEAARTADTAWREDWFTPERWQQIRPWLEEIAENASRFGPLRRLTLVGKRAEGDARDFIYRIDYADLTRVIRYRIDAADRIKSSNVVDE